MIFPREKKKELWRYASKNNPATCDADGIPKLMQQLQRPLPLHQCHPQRYARCCEEESLPMRQLNTPPPPYCSTPCSMDCSDYNRLHNCHRTKIEPDLSWSASATANLDYCYIKDGCSYASSVGDMLSDENERQSVPVSACYKTHPEPERSFPLTPAVTFATTAANMFRNCCGGGEVTDSSSGSFSRTTTLPDSRRHILSRQRTSTHTSPMHPHSLKLNTAVTTAGSLVPTTVIRLRTLNQNFNALLKSLRNKQIAVLLQAVKSRVDATFRSHPLPATGAVPSTAPSYLQCILIKCTSSADEAHHVVTCQLFFWSDLRSSGELRRLPICPSAWDYIYVCCNPLHWYRIIHPIESEFAAPPYQRSKMLRLGDADSEGNVQAIDRSAAAASTVQGKNHSQSISSVLKQTESQHNVPCLQSFTTDGKDHSACSKEWCQIAYWELSRRVGEFFHARKSAVNIYADGPIDCAGESMCLRNLGKQTPSHAVQHTLQKVGLGVTLSLEYGDVWIYNRSNVAIFVDSPTLAEHLDRVFKVPPGYCLKVFETHKAQFLACKQSQQNQLGPIDRFSIKISFAKGWGNTYRRQDIMCCPCWLEVHFGHLR